VTRVGPLALAVALALALVGSISLTHPSAPSMTVNTVEVLLGKSLSGSSVGVNSTNGSVSIPERVISLSTDTLFYLNNTHATDSYYVKLVEYSATGLTGVSTLNLGINANGTSTDQINASSGSLTGTAGAYVRVWPSTTNTIYAKTLMVGLTHTTDTVIGFEVYVADDTSESAYYTMRAQFTAQS
jgi:hypothetical protein